MKKKTNTVFFIVTGFLTTILSYGLSELYNENVYYFGYELVVIFTIILIVLFTKEELSKIELSNIKFQFRIFNGIFYKYFSVFYIAVILLTILTILTNPNSFSHGLLPFLLPIISVLLMVDVIISMFLKEASQKNKGIECFNLNPSMIDLLLVPFFFTSFISILGEFLNVRIAVLLVLLFALTLSFKLLVIKQFRSVL